MADKYIPCITVIHTIINQLEYKVSLITTYLLPEAICCCLQTLNVVASEVTVADKYIPCTVHPHLSDPLWAEGCSNK